jgi:hypothetical protein
MRTPPAFALAIRVKATERARQADCTGNHPISMAIDLHHERRHERTTERLTTWTTHLLAIPSLKHDTPLFVSKYGLRPYPGMDTDGGNEDMTITGRALQFDRSSGSTPTLPTPRTT